MNEQWNSLISQMFEFGYNFMKIPFSIMGKETNLLSILAVLFVLRLILYVIGRIFGTNINTDVVERSWNSRLRDSSTQLKAKQQYRNSELKNVGNRLMKDYRGNSHQQAQRKEIRDARRRGINVDIKSNIKAKKKGSVKRTRKWWG